MPITAEEIVKQIKDATEYAAFDEYPTDELFAAAVNQMRDRQGFNDEFGLGYVSALREIGTIVRQLSGDH